MYKSMLVFFGLAIAAVAVASPTANEDYVDRQDAQTYTNALNAAKAYADSIVGGGGGGGTPESYAYVSNRAESAYAGMAVKLDKGSFAWDKGQLNFDTSTADDGIYFRDLFQNVWIAILTDGDYFEIKSNYSDWSWLVNTEGDTLQDTLDPLVSHVGNKENPHGVTASQVGAYSASDGEILADQVSAIGAHLNAEDTHFVVTNYDSVVRIPEASVEIKMSGEWLTIWKEMTRWRKWAGDGFDWETWNGFYDYRTNFEADVTLRINDAKCWGIYNSETGEPSPEGFVQISSSNILIAANMAYQRTVTTGGAVWVLQCNTGVATIGGDTNGFFRIMDSDGATQFEIVKGDKREVGADADGITVDTANGNVMTIHYSIEGPTPTIQCCNDLRTADWKSQDDADCLVTVSWSGSSGSWVATVTPKTAQSQMFVRATYMAGGETYIHNVAPVSMDSIYLNGTKYYLGTATIDGHTVLTLSTSK